MSATQPIEMEDRMFVFTAKLNRKKVIVFVVALAVLLAAVILLVSLRGSHSKPQEGASVPLTVSDAAGAAAYLSSLGWQVDAEPIETKELVIPRSFTGVYADYAALQTSQGYPLTEYGGMKATRYTFRVKNYPSGEENIVADLVVCNGTVIAGDIQCTASDGFMVGLKSTN